MPKPSIRLSIGPATRLSARLASKWPRRRGFENYYHIVLRGNGRDALATTAKDRRALNLIAMDALRRFDIKLHAYCLLANHLRALVQIDDRFLAKALRQVAARYSRFRLSELKTSGPLFERPYRAQRVDSEKQFLELLRLIHLNPVIANEVVTPADYLWSSHRSYLGYRSNALITTDFGLSLLAADRSQARALYSRFIEEGVAMDDLPFVPSRPSSIVGASVVTDPLQSAAIGGVASSAVIEPTIRGLRAPKFTLRPLRKRSADGRRYRFLSIY